MTISFIGSYVGTHAATSAQTVNFSNLRDEANAQPTLLEGDLVLVAVNNASTVNRTNAELTPSGYTEVSATDLYQNDSNDVNLLVSRKFMGASPDTSVAIPASNATTAGVGYAIYVFRGVDPTTPLDVAATTAGANNTGVANGAAITPSTAGAWIAVFAGAAVAAGAVFTNPSGMSSTTNHFRSATITTTTNDANIGAALKTDWTSGSFDPAVFGGSTSTNTGSWSAVTVALRPIADPVDEFVAGTGTAVLGGAGALSQFKTVAGTGAAALDSSASLGLFKSLSGGGVLAFGGVAAVSIETAVNVSGAGSIASSGNAALVVDRKLTGSGAAVLGGAAAASTERNLVGVGAAALDAGAELAAERFVAGSGAAELGNVVHLATDRAFAASGAIGFGAGAAMRADRGLEGADGSVFGGVAGLEIEGSGGTDVLLVGGGEIAIAASAWLSADKGVAGMGTVAAAGTSAVGVDRGFIGIATISLGGTVRLMLRVPVTPPARAGAVSEPLRAEHIQNPPRSVAVARVARVGRFSG